MRASEALRRPAARSSAALLATARAELGARRGATRPGRLRGAAAAAWAGLGRPYPAALRRSREAEALAAAGDRDAAAEAALDALRRRRSGSARGWLRGGDRGARRARPARPTAAGGAGAGRGAASRTDPFGLTAARAPGARAARRGRDEPRDRRRALHGREDRERPRLADPPKLDVRTRTEAAAVAHRLGLV